MITQKVKDKLKELPDHPGVYIMRNADDKIIYVGKAISLKKRVRQYFDNSKNKGRKVLAMVSHIDHFEYILVENEIEALVLESNLIKKNRPKYNIVLRDDKQYPYIKITNEKFPRIKKVRQVKNDKASYFGPYPDAYAVNDSIDLFHDLYPIKTCNLNFDKGQRLKRPCLNYYIGRCKAPCVGKADEEKYLENIEKVKRFLDSKDDEILEEVLLRMEEASKSLNFEQAAKYRDYHKALMVLREKQKVTNTNGEDMDIIAMSRGKSNVTIEVFFMRNGKIVDREDFILKDDYNDSKENIMSSFLMQFYLDMTYIPKEILLEVIPNDIEIINKYISDKKGSSVYIHQPKLGKKKALIDMAIENADDTMFKYEKRIEKRERSKSNGLISLKKILKLDDLRRIECYDISNTSGIQSVGSMVVFENGIPNSKEYRKFKIKTVQGPNDYVSLEEVLTRRLKRGKEEKEKGNTKTGFGDMPSLILMDGGKGQVSIAKNVIDKLKINVEIAGLVKDDKHTTRAIIYNGKEINIDHRDPAYKLIYQIQEEAHRFAINYHRKLRNKTMQKSELDNIKGIGKQRRINLYNHFKSVKNIKKASVEELSEVPLIGKKQALEIYKYFKLKG